MPKCLNWRNILSWIPFGSYLDPNSDNVFFFLLFKGERIQISQKAGHHRPTSEMPLNGVSLACWWWPNIECWLGSFWEFQGIRSSIAKKFYVSGGGSGPPVPPRDPRMGPDYVYTTHFIVRIGFCTRSTSRERERCVFFLNFVIIFTQRARLRISKICVYLCKKFWSTRCPWVTVLHYKRHLHRWRASEKRFGFLKEERKCSDLSVVRG